jgi:imidazolonepropionase-like amidohydrolase
VRPNAEYFKSETFKVYHDHTTDRRARQLLSLAAAEEGLNATTHTNGLELALASVIDGFSGIEHAPDIPIYDDVATLIARSGTTYTQTYGTSVPGSSTYLRRRTGWPWDEAQMRRFVPPSLQRTVCRTCTGKDLAMFSAVEFDNLLPLLRGAARIAARGGRIGMGAENDVPTLDIHYEMWLHALGGMPNHDVLRSATIVGAEAIGHAKDLGSLESGKLADLQILNANPLTDIHNTTAIRYVMKNGRLYEAEDLTEIWPRRTPLGAPYVWHTASPRDSSTAQRAGSRQGRPKDGRGSVPGRSAVQCDGLRSGRCRGGTT